jgi:hypothetical protein
LATAISGHSAALQTSGAGTPPEIVALIALARATAANGSKDAARGQLVSAEKGVAAMGPAGARLNDAIREIQQRYGL